MDTGTRISAVAHAGLIAALVLGDLFSGSGRARPLPPVAEVSLISAEDFAALTAPTAAAPVPQPRPEAPVAAPAPAPPPAPPPVPQPAPEPEPAAEAEPEPERVAALPPVEAVPAPMVLPPVPPPAAEVPAPVPAPVASPVPLPRPAQRVAPEPAPPPPEDAATAPVAREAPAPVAEAERTVPAEPPAAPEAATTQIITEATRTDRDGGGAPMTSPRPQPRPAQPARQAAAPQPQTQTQPQRAETPRPQPTAPRAEAPAPEPELPDALLASIAEAAAAALAAETPRPGLADRAVPAGALGAGEADALRRAVQGCWNLGALSTEAMATTVTVAFAIGRDRRPTGEMRLADWSGPNATAAQQAYEAARRAILRCGADGFPLDPEAFEVWRDVEMTFNPESMRIR